MWFCGFSKLQGKKTAGSVGHQERSVEMIQAIPQGISKLPNQEDSKQKYAGNFNNCQGSFKVVNDRARVGVFVHKVDFNQIRTI